MNSRLSPAFQVYFFSLQACTAKIYLLFHLGIINYNDTKIQLLDLPGIIEGAAQGKGRGRQVIAVAKSGTLSNSTPYLVNSMNLADLVLMVLDASKEGTTNNHRKILETELEMVGLRLNQDPPDIYFKPKAGGGIAFTTTCPQPHFGPDPKKIVLNILKEYKIHNAEVLFREEVTVDQFIDVVEVSVTSPSSFPALNPPFVVNRETGNTLSVSMSIIR